MHGEIERRTPSNFGGHSPPVTPHVQPIITNDEIPTSPLPQAVLSPSKVTVEKQYSDKYTSPSPTHSICMSTSVSFSRERNLENDIEMLQEKLKDTEELLQSLRLQHDTLSLEHRTVRDSLSSYHDESERLQIDVQHLNDCANVLRAELKTTRADRADALELQKVLYRELDESRTEKKKAQDQSESDSKTIQDLQRQCKEMERILMRKYPDSVSALIGNTNLS